MIGLKLENDVFRILTPIFIDLYKIHVQDSKVHENIIMVYLAKSILHHASQNYRH